jgi:four helix bundle protein
MTTSNTSPPVKQVQDLLAWQVAMDLAVAVYAATRAFPQDERFGLRMQVRRAAVSIPSNIAEGHGRVNRREYAHFVAIARGSLKEVETQLLLSGRLGFLTQSDVSKLWVLVVRLNKLLTGLKRGLRG